MSGGLPPTCGLASPLRHARENRDGMQFASGIGTPALPGPGGGVGQELSDPGEDAGADDTKMEVTKA
jgi:hypothetical protein